MGRIDKEAERERLQRIFDEIEAELSGKTPEPEKPEKTQAERDADNRRCRIDRIASLDAEQFIGCVDDRLRTKAFRTDWEEILCRQYQSLFRFATVPGQLKSEVNVYRSFVGSLIAELNRCTELAKSLDNHHFYKVFADYVRKHVEKL